ncbi:MAG TPA: hypothetical protein VKU90_14920 [Caulobacteraceae bacterium]|jgi:hypothetical protein|nr:hypothetical protein [Caulobacteraceae bacterium]
MGQRMFAILAAMAAATALSGCETATPYQPLATGAAQSGGYSEARIETDRWRVSFTGNDLTNRSTVETYLLYRAAELTVAQGYDWFETVDRATETHAHTYAYDDGPYGFGPSWRFRRRGFGWWGPGYWPDDLDVQTVERFDASAEILMHHGPKPSGNPHAFDARDVMSNLASKIVRPS